MLSRTMWRSVFSIWKKTFFKRFIINNQKCAFIVEHDFIMSTYLADQVIVYEGEPGVKCVANSPQGLLEGMNKFLGMLEITFRRDPANFRPRINKLNSVLDKEQKGYIRATQVGQILRTMGQAFEERDLKQLIKEFDSDGNCIEKLTSKPSIS